MNDEVFTKRLAETRARQDGRPVPQWHGLNAIRDRDNYCRRCGGQRLVFAPSCYEEARLMGEVKPECRCTVEELEHFRMTGKTLADIYNEDDEGHKIYTREEAEAKYR